MKKAKTESLTESQSQIETRIDGGSVARHFVCKLGVKGLVL